jgi:hypothetical protein
MLSAKGGTGHPRNGRYGVNRRGVSEPIGVRTRGRFREIVAKLRQVDVLVSRGGRWLTRYERLA